MVIITSNLQQTSMNDAFMCHRLRQSEKLKNWLSEAKSQKARMVISFAERTPVTVYFDTHNEVRDFKQASMQSNQTHMLPLGR